MKLFISIIGFLILSACSVTNVDIKQSEYICKDHGGISKVDNTIFMSIHCLDGTSWLQKSTNLKGIGG